MPQITHQQVRMLLQTAANKTLPLTQQTILDTHLAECVPCRTYAESLDDLQAGLRRVMRQQWNVHNAPLPVQTIKARSRRVALQNKISGAIGRFAVAPALAFAFILMVRMIAPQQAALDVGALRSNTPALSWRTPTPSYQTTSTEVSAPECVRVAYTVRAADTLDGIAARYRVSAEAILAYNGLPSATVEPNSTLLIPLCGSTPTGTLPVMESTSMPVSSSASPSPAG